MWTLKGSGGPLVVEGQLVQWPPLALLEGSLGMSTSASMEELLARVWMEPLVWDLQARGRGEPSLVVDNVLLAKTPPAPMSHQHQLLLPLPWAMPVSGRTEAVPRWLPQDPLVKGGGNMTSSDVLSYRTG